MENNSSMRLAHDFDTQLICTTDVTKEYIDSQPEGTYVYMGSGVYIRQDCGYYGGYMTGTSPPSVCARLDPGYIFLSKGEDIHDVYERSVFMMHTLQTMYKEITLQNLAEAENDTNRYIGIQNSKRKAAGKPCYHIHIPFNYQFELREYNKMRNQYHGHLIHQETQKVK